LVTRGTGRILRAFLLGLGALSAEEFNKSGHFRALRRNTVFGNVRATFGRGFGRPIGLGAAATVQRSYCPVRFTNPGFRQ
jgi:hypothetical protein